MKNLQSFLTIALCIATLLSCEKEEPVSPEVPVLEIPTTDPDPIPDPQPSTTNLSKLFEHRLTALTQSFTISSNIHQTITGNQGTKLSIPANAFVNALGNPINGTVEIRLIEVMNKADMILTNMPTSSGGEILVSGGEINVEAYQDGQELYLANGKSIAVSVVPNGVPDSQMRLFDPVLDSQGNFEDWTPANAPLGFIPDTIGNDSIIDSASLFYSFDLTNTGLGWANCDYFYSNPDPKTTLTVMLPRAHNISNTNVFLHLTNSPSVIGLSTLNSATNSVLSYPNSIPIGLQATLVAISEINGQYYSAIVPITILPNHGETINFSTTTEQGIIDAINAL